MSDIKNNGQNPALLSDDTFNDDTLVQTFGELSDRNSDFDAAYDAASERMNKHQLAMEHFTSFDIGAGMYKALPCDLFPTDNNKPMRLIGIAGQARSGKDTLASYLLDNLDDIWLRSSFADPIKEMLRAIGVDCSDDKKAVTDDSYGVTPRHMMQTLGTEWGCHTIDDDIWVKAFARLNAGKCVIVPDVRFDNEADLVREHGILIHIVGRGGIKGSHVSENAIEFKPGDIVIDNSRDLIWLHGQVDGNQALHNFVSEAE